MVEKEKQGRYYKIKCSCGQVEYHFVSDVPPKPFYLLCNKCGEYNKIKKPMLRTQRKTFQTSSMVKILNDEDPRISLIDELRNTFRSVIFSKISDYDLSRIIYEDPKFIKDNFLHNRKIKTKSRPDLLVLLKIIYFVRIKNTTDSFINKFGLNQRELINLKKKITKIVIDFIFSNPYRTKYIKPDKRAKFLKLVNF